MLLLAFLLALAAPVAADTTGLPHYPDGVRYVDVDGRRIAFVERGAGEALVLVHGLGSNLSFWRETLEAFPDRRVLALDLPGYGLSDKADVPGTMTHFADVVAGFMTAVGVERAVVVGSSMGGQIGLTLALRHPERVAALVLAAPAGIEMFAPEAAAGLKTMVTPASIMATEEPAVRAMTALNFGTWDERHGWLVEQRLALARRPDFAGYAEANARSVAGMLDEPVADRLADVAAPTLVVFGTQDRLIPNRYLNPGTPADVARRAAEVIPGARLHLLDGAGHLLMLEQPAAFHAAVRAFLAAR